MYTEWTKNILEQYSRHEDEVIDVVGTWLADEDGLNQKDIDMLCKVWWITLCSHGRSGILHPQGSDLNMHTLVEITDAANIKGEELIVPIVDHDDYVEKCRNGEEEPDLGVWYINPISVYLSDVKKISAIEAIKALTQDLIYAIAQIGVQAEKIGGDAWESVVIKKMNQTAQEAAQELSENGYIF